MFVGTDKQMQIINTRILSLSLSLFQNGHILEKKSSSCFTEYNCRSFNIYIVKQFSNIKLLAASSLSLDASQRA